MSDNALPHLSFSTEDVDPTDRVEAWRQTLASMFDPTPKVAPQSLQGRLDIYHLGQIMAGGVDFPDHHFRRDKAWASKSGFDHYFLQIYLEGGYVGSLGGSDVALRAGDVEVLHMGQTFDTMAAASSTFGVMIPKDLLDQRMGSIADLHGTVLKRDSSAGALLGSYLRTLRDVLPKATAQEAPMIVEGCLGLVAASLRPTADALAAAAPQIGAVLTDRILHHVEAHLDSPSLGTESLCVQFRLSRSYLYRLMEPFGGVANHIRRRRLHRAMAMLSQPQGRGSRICDIAYACGFSDEKAFGRAFRAEFDMTPSEARKGAGESMPTKGTPQFSQWLVGLGRPRG